MLTNFYFSDITHANVEIKFTLASSHMCSCFRNETTAEFLCCLDSEEKELSLSNLKKKIGFQSGNRLQWQKCHNLREKNTEQI